MNAQRSTLDVDVAIIGAGVVGCAIAMRLSRARLDYCVIERRHDVAEETSKSNTGVADCGWECAPGSLEADIITSSSRRWEEIGDRLDTPFRRCGGLSIARTAEEEARLGDILAAAEANGVRARRMDAGELRRRAPYVIPEARAAVEVPDEGVIDSIRLTLGYAELAARNGVRFFLNQPLVGAEVRAERIRGAVYARHRSPSARFVVDAAGLGADAVSMILGAEEFSIWPRRGEYLLIDREVGQRIDHIVTQLPNEHTRGVMVVPATHSSLLLGPTADDDDDKFDRSTNSVVLERVLAECRTLVSGLRREDVIKSFTGLRPATERTYRVEQSTMTKNLIHACGIRSTGVSGSPGIADRVHDLLVDAGLNAPQDSRALDRLPRRPRISEGASCETMALDPLGRTVVCACEKVTAREIHDAMRSAVPACSISGIAKRTRATWGRCQGAACLSGVSFIASQYLDGPAWALPFGEDVATLGVAESSRA